MDECRRCGQQTLVKHHCLGAGSTWFGETPCPQGAMACHLAVYCTACDVQYSQPCSEHVRAA